MMKTMTGIAFALAVLSASPASAQAFQGNWWDAYHSFSQPDSAYDAYASYPVHRRHSPRRSWDVYNTNGRYAGSDPDPNVRDMIARDPEDEGRPF
jgi:hypothetical protein